MAFQQDSFQNNAFQIVSSVITAVFDYITFARRRSRR